MPHKNLLLKSSKIDPNPVAGAQVNQDILELKELMSVIEQDLKLKQKRIVELEKEINDITPLKKHLKRQIWRHLDYWDYRFMKRLEGRHIYKPVVAKTDDNFLENAQENDLANFNNYNKNAKFSIPLKTYLFIRRIFAKIARRILGYRKRMVTR